MKKTSLLLWCMSVFMFVSGSSAVAQDKTLFDAESFMSSQGEFLPFRVLRPANFDPDKKYPVVLFLHGAGERGDDNEAQLTNGVTVFSTERNRQQFPCFVIAPQCPKEGYWSSAKFTRDKYPIDFDFNYSYPITPSLEAVMELLSSYIEEPYIDKNRVYITGLSMGGMGTFEAVGRFPELFAAAAPVCGGGDPKAYTKETAKAAFWIFHGDKDGVVPVENSQRMYARLVALGASVRYKEYPGVEHNSWDNAYGEVTLLPWMFSKSRK